MPAVVIKDVSVILGKDYPALQDISIALPAGKVIGFIGPSGAGKTTLIRSIVGRQKISGGSILVLGKPAGSVELRQHVSYMTQEASVYSDLTVQENIRYFATMVGVSRDRLDAEIARLLEVVDLQSHANQVVENLSGGQKQRVSLAIALIGNPQLLVLDEPTVGLDPVLREQLWKLFRTLAGQGTTLIISSHVMDEAERCDDLLLIRDGRLLARGTPQGLCRQTDTKSVEQSFLKLVGENK